MNFADVTAAFTDLRYAVQTQISPFALNEVSVRGPSGKADEAAFLRLTAWSFCLLFEEGRVVIPFFLQDKLPGGDRIQSQQHRETRLTVQALRTWFFHSLTLTTDHDYAVGKRVADWFLAASNVVAPQNANQWEICHSELCKRVQQAIVYCTCIISTVAASDDRDMIITDLKGRLKRQWAPHEFDEFVTDAAARLGENINARAFRERRLEDWRKFLGSVPDDQDCGKELERLIDAEVANHFRTLLPITTREIMDALQLSPGPRVKDAVNTARRLYDSGVRNKEALLQALSAEIKHGFPNE